MTPIEQFLKDLVMIDVWLIVKIAILASLVIYVIFAGIVIRQVGLMRKTVKGELDLLLKFAAWIHLGAAIAVFLLALIWL